MTSLTERGLWEQFWGPLKGVQELFDIFEQRPEYGRSFSPVFLEVLCRHLDLCDFLIEKIETIKRALDGSDDELKSLIMVDLGLLLQILESDRRAVNEIGEMTRNTAYRIEELRRDLEFYTRNKFDLRRFVTAQEQVYATILTELRSGQKKTHWMWFIFPQIDGLAMSQTSKHYAIKSIDEAKRYLDHPLLGPRLIECSEAVLAVEDASADDIFGYPDDLKLRSSMTLFSSITGSTSVFCSVLDKYFQGETDESTIHILKGLAKG